MAKDKSKQKVKRIVKAKIDFISLCPRGATLISTLYKSDEGDISVELTTICKDMNEQGEIIACMYAPEKVDHQGDIASEAVIKDFAYDFQKNGSGIDIKHNEVVISKDDAYVAQSFVIQEGDERYVDMKDYDGNVVDVTGGWGVILKIESDDLKDKYRSGDWSGVSMGGIAFKTDDESTGIAKALKSIADYFNKENKISKSHKKAESIMAISKEDQGKIDKQIADGIAEGLKKHDETKAAALKKSQEEGTKGLGLPEPILKSNPTKEERVEHIKKLEIFEISKTVNPKDTREMYAFEERAEEIAKSKDIKETLRKQAQDPYASFFDTNLSADEVSKSASTVNEDNDDGISELLEKKLDEEEKAKK